MHRPAFAAALLSALTIALWALWPTPMPTPAPTQAVSIGVDQFHGIAPAICGLTAHRQEMSR